MSPVQRQFVWFFASFAVALAFVAGPLVGTCTAAPFDVNQGWDLFQTLPGTQFMGVPLNGVPIGNFDFRTGTLGDFGRPITEPVSVGNADTIMKRLAVATPPGLPGTAPPIPIEMVALQLETAVPVDFGAGTGFYFVTLQSARGAPNPGNPPYYQVGNAGDPAAGPMSSGTMTISFDPTGNTGTFTTMFDVPFDLRFGALNGPIVMSNDLVLSDASPIQWARNDLGARMIDGVNHNLNGVNIGNDFWPLNMFNSNKTVADHIVSAAVPEPSSAVLGLIGLVSVAAIAVRRRRARRLVG